MTKPIYLKEVAPPGHHIQRTPEEALEEAKGLLKSEGFNAERVIIIIADDKAEDSCYRWMQGGGISHAEMLWDICQIKAAIIDGQTTDIL